MTPAQTELFKAASSSRDKSYSPYSRHKVGAAIRTKSGKIYAGCNVENSSFGGTCCAERVAIHSAVAENGGLELAEIMVVTDASPPWPPCGLCRQVIAEFVQGRDVPVHSANLKGEIVSFSFNALFPSAFTPGHLLS